MKRLLILGAVLALAGCEVSPTDANRALDANGLKDVNLTGYALWGCDEKDTYKTGFTATTASDAHIRGVVCASIFKGATVRITG